MVLVDLVQHRTIAYSQQSGCCFPIPTSFLESHGDCVPLGFPLDALDQRFQRFRDGRAPASTLLGYARGWNGIEGLPVSRVAIAPVASRSWFEPVQAELFVAGDQVALDECL